MRLALALLIAVSSYNIIHHHYNIDITDILSQLKADADEIINSYINSANPIH